MSSFSSSGSAHHRACVSKRLQRDAALRALPPLYRAPLSPAEHKLHAMSLAQLVAHCSSGAVAPAAVLAVYMKKALCAHAATNCLSDLMPRDALQIPAVANWGSGVDTAAANDPAPDRLLMGVPVSIKDTINIAGHDTTLGYSRNVGRPAPASSAIVRLLQDAGALVHVKTTAPTGLLAIETFSDLFGSTTNPYSSVHTAGASTGGGAALLASGGCKVEVGSDIAGSIRIPAHFCGVWSLKGSAGRFPDWGNVSSMPGLEAVPIVSAPMAASLHDLHEFWKRVVQCKPWKYDHTCVPLPWQHVDLLDQARKLKWGILPDDGTIPPTPACQRALDTVAHALRKAGHEVVPFHAPDVQQGLNIAYQLLFADGGKQISRSLQPHETITPPSRALLDLLNLPRLVKLVIAFVTSLRDPWSAGLLRIMHTKTVSEERDMVVARDRYRAAWHEKLSEEGIDFVLTVPNALPALENGDSKATTLMSAGYTTLFSLLDYTAGVLPVTFVDRETDALPDGFEGSPAYAAMTTIGRAAYSVYKPDTMHGLPLGVQVVGKRMEEEKVLEGMKIVEAALAAQGVVFSGRVGTEG